jgi:hypothetical protein
MKGYITMRHGNKKPCFSRKKRSAQAAEGQEEEEVLEMVAE